MSKLNKLQKKTELISSKNDYSKAILESIEDSFTYLVECSDAKENAKELTFYELQRIAKRTEIMFNLLKNLTDESDDLNTELSEELNEMVSKEK